MDDCSQILEHTHKHTHTRVYVTRNPFEDRSGGTDGLIAMTSCLWCHITHTHTHTLDDTAINDCQDMDDLRPQTHRREESN